MVGERRMTAVGVAIGRASAVGVGDAGESVGTGAEAGLGVLGVGEGAESAEMSFTGEGALLVGVGCVVSSVVAVTTTVT